MFVEHFLVFSGAFMHFWVKRFESLFKRFESLFPERSLVVKKCLSDSNPFFQQPKRFEAIRIPLSKIRIRFSVAKKFSSDSNPSLNDSNLFSSSLIVLKRFKSLFRGFESFYKKSKNFKIFNRRFESLFRGFESPCPLKRKTVHFLQNLNCFIYLSKTFLSILPPSTPKVF